MCNYRDLILRSASFRRNRLQMTLDKGGKIKRYGQDLLLANPYPNMSHLTWRESNAGEWEPIGQEQYEEKNWVNDVFKLERLSWYHDHISASDSLEVLTYSTYPLKTIDSFFSAVFCFAAFDLSPISLWTAWLLTF